MVGYSLHSTIPRVNAHISEDPLIIFLNTGYSGCVLFHDTAVPKHFHLFFMLIQLLLVVVKKDRCPDVLLGSYNLHLKTYGK